MYIVYGKGNCSFCVQAMELLKVNNKEFIYKSLDIDFTRDELFEALSAFGVTPRSMPQVVVDEEYIVTRTRLTQAKSLQTSCVICSGSFVTAYMVVSIATMTGMRLV